MTITEMKEYLMEELKEEKNKMLKAYEKKQKRGSKKK